MMKRLKASRRNIWYDTLSSLFPSTVKWTIISARDYYFFCAIFNKFLISVRCQALFFIFTAFASQTYFHWQSAIKVSKQNAHISLTNILFQHNNNNNNDNIYETNKQSTQNSREKGASDIFFYFALFRFV